MRDLIPTVKAWRARGDCFARATVVKTSGSTPRPLGAKMVVNSRGEFAGSVSGGCVEGAVIEAAQRVIATGEPQLLEFGIADEAAWEVGLACGGALAVFVERTQPARQPALEEQLERDLADEIPCAMATVVRGARVGAKMLVYLDRDARGEWGDAHTRAPVEADARRALQSELPASRAYGDGLVFVDVFAPKPRLVIVGGVHVAIPLTRFAQSLGFRVTIVDGRSRFATRERFPTADEIIVAYPQDAFARMRIDASTYVAILTHDPKFDLPALQALAMRQPRYVGAMGARETRARHFAELRAAGVSEEFLARVYAPIGLDVGARTPEEVALAILAEMVAVRYGRRGGFLATQ